MVRNINSSTNTPLQPLLVVPNKNRTIDSFDRLTNETPRLSIILSGSLSVLSFSVHGPHLDQLASLGIQVIKKMTFAFVMHP